MVPTSPRAARRILAALLAALTSLATGVTEAAGSNWRNHAQPFDFLFSNGIDTHQQTRLAHGSLAGFLYVKFTGQVTTDGHRIARHVDCNAESGCTVGWLLRGEPATARFLYHVSGDHPVWQADRHAVPQPGVYTHFHWLGSAHPVLNEVRDGFLLELQAVDHFCFIHGSSVPSGAIGCREAGGVVVSPGLDAATHTNIVGSFPNGNGGGR